MNDSHPEYVDCIVTEGEVIVFSGEAVIIVIDDNDDTVSTQFSPKSVYVKQAQDKEQMQS